MIGWAFNRLIGTKFEIIIGYVGVAPAGLALERGEVHIVGSASLDFLKAQTADWLREKKVTMIFSNEVRRNPEFPDAPTIAALVPAGAPRQIMDALASASSLGRAFAAPPEIPAQAKTILRKAFADMIADPELLADAKRRNIDINPATGEDLERMVAQVAALPKPIIARIVAVTSPPAGSTTAR